MDLTMIDYILIIGFLIIAGLIIAYVGLGVDVKQIDPLDQDVFDKPKKTKHKKH
jgi:hypothetical protein